MLTPMTAYVIVALIMVATMTLMILKIGTLLGDCPQSGRAARAAAVTIATGYAMIGTGGVGLIGALIPLADTLTYGILVALGLAAVCLGLGFTHAVATLRAVMREALDPGLAQPPAATNAHGASAA